MSIEINFQPIPPIVRRAPKKYDALCTALKANPGESALVKTAASVSNATYLRAQYPELTVVSRANADTPGKFDIYAVYLPE